MKFTICWMVLIILLISCSDKATQETIKIGVSVPLTGSGAHLGEPYFQGVEFAYKEINAAGGINGKKLELFVEDNQNSPKEGVSVFHALELRHPDLILSTMSTATMSMAPLAKEAGIPVFASMIYADLTSVNDNAVVFFSSAKQEAKLAVDDMKKNNINKVGVIYINSEYGKASMEGFVAEAKSRGITISAVEVFDGDLTDYSTPILKIEKENPQAVYIIAINTVPILQHLKSTDSKLIAYANIVSIGGNLIYQSDVFEGVHLTAPPVSVPASIENTNFHSKIQGSIPLEKNTLAYNALGYDSLYAIAAVLKKNPNAKDFVKTFSSYGVFKGAAGEYNLKGRKVEMPLYPVVFKEGELQLVQ
ncbi:MAG TPA: penicillin-binding protein activator [Candidatus Nanoarchaeia archaeon]|nr:penicillin-binding protein activator [Candidatus Nanoarchaeia archaeon]